MGTARPAGLSLTRVAATGALVAATALTGCSGTDHDAGPEPSAPSSSEATGEATDEAAPPADDSTPDPTAGVARPTTAAEAARRLVAADRAISHRTTPARELVRAARQQQLAYRALGDHPEWDAAVLAAVPPSVRGVVRSNLEARRELRAMHVVLSDTLPAWRIVRPAPAERLLRYYQRAERAYGIEWEYLAAVNLVETGMGRIRGTSTAGARGPMQFLPSTWARWGRGDIDDPADAIMAAARYLAHDGGARPGGLDAALYRYNNSRHYVRAITLLGQVMERRPRAFYGYYHWDVYYLTSRGDVRLPVGYDQDRPVPVTRWLAAHPQE
ncbi:MAG TPA: transglycosylase SLT domain-containing protein [Nocardioides sp.]|uniref:lytic transglycosylase domain-containing protein n=1 Tax=Nocardioides sp. TaxID=35761 RepID=UPI002E2EC3F0|nr:transglycosylase SLT domain-containing protein [Nocardioides sp.]HEX5089718.1 transglycosylase SLT domain-containing protein [Nocardioides sp.]